MKTVVTAQRISNPGETPSPARFGVASVTGNDASSRVKQNPDRANTLNSHRQHHSPPPSPNMSSHKRPLGELSNNTPSNPRTQRQTQTPRRYAPSTPHAIRALQQRSGAKTRSVRPRKFAAENVDPASARGVLRQFAKLTAPSTRPLKTPETAGKENLRPTGDVDDEDDEDHLSKRPRMTFDIDESIDESMEEEEPPQYEEEDSDLPVAPTPSVLPEDGDEDPTITFQSIDFGRDGQKRMSRMSMPVGDEDLDADATIMTEHGRRAFTEDATGRLSRYSFGSIRMSDFGSELEYPNNPDAMKARLSETNAEMRRRRSIVQQPILDATEDLSHLAQRIHDNSDVTNHDVGPMIGNDDDDDFQLEVPADEDVGGAVSRQQQLDALLQTEEDGWEDAEEETAENEPVHLSPTSKRRLTELQLANSKPKTERRRKRIKMTRHGTLVPSLPSSLIKKLATEVHVRNGRRKPVFGPEHIKALEQATEWFFEQVGEDLAAYSSHGRRKRRIDTSDVLLLMRRQRVLQGTGELRKLAKHWLPKDIRATLDLPDTP